MKNICVTEQQLLTLQGELNLPCQILKPVDFVDNPAIAESNYSSNNIDLRGKILIRSRAK